MSATEVGILKLLAPTAVRTQTYLCLKILDVNAIEESTNTTYGQLLANLTDVATYAQAVMVPRELIYPRVSPYADSFYGYYTEAATTFVQQAHSAQLEVYVYDFANDNFPSSYNYSFDPVFEIVNYIGDTFTVDGVLSDFPTTAAEAISEFLTCCTCVLYYSNFWTFSLLNCRNDHNFIACIFGFNTVLTVNGVPYHLPGIVNLIVFSLLL